MEIVFSKHALNQLAERNIYKKEVIELLDQPEKIIKQSSTRRKAAGFISRNRKRYLLVAVYDMYNSTKEVVTAFLTSKIDKYL